jgi:hypothetical protein
MFTGITHKKDILVQKLISYHRKGPPSPHNLAIKAGYYPSFGDTFAVSMFFIKH